MVLVNWFMTVVKKYAEFKGRASRAEFWWYYLGYIILMVVVSIIDSLIRSSFFTTILSLGLLLPTLGVSIRRMHDVGKSGWFILIPIYDIILAATDGQPGDNQYGPNPKAAA
jgi:uncharacterized membrane protein YhaH (DUF805 family)